MDRRGFLSAITRPPAAASAASASGSLFSATPSLEPYNGPWTMETAAHLLRRTVLAPTYDELQLARSMTMEQVVTKLTTLDPNLPAPARYTSEWLQQPTHYYDTNRQDITRAYADELRRWWCGLMLSGGISIRERMTLFWHNHFPCDISITRDGRYEYIQNQLFREKALGNFKQLVRDVSVDKSMLWFLDGKLSKKGKEVNENYARELQELFTIGLFDNDGKANYTQKDVSEAARALTGWGWWGEGMTGTVECPPWYGHDPTDKVVYGVTIQGKEYGDGELDALLDIIFAKEQTARYVIRKLYRFFVYTDAPLTPASKIPDEIEENIIAPLAAEFRASNWSIELVVRRLLSSKHFYDPQVIASGVKSPIDFMVGTARALMVNPPTGDSMEFLMQAAHASATKLGQWLFIPPGVQGWQFYRTWISGTTLPQRHSFTDALIDGTLDASYNEVAPGDLDGVPQPKPGTAGIDVLAYARQFPSFKDDPIALVADIAGHLLAYPASGRLLEQLKEALLQGDPSYEWSGLNDTVREQRLKGMLKFLMRSANYQLM